MLHCISILPKLECLVRTPDLKRQFRLISPSNRKLSPNLLVILPLWRIHSSLKQNKYSVRRRYFCTFEHIESKHPRSNPYYNLGILYIYLSRYLLYLLPSWRESSWKMDFIQDISPGKRENYKRFFQIWYSCLNCK